MFRYPLLYGVKGHVAEAAHHQQRQLGQTDADDEQQRTAQEDKRRPGEEQPRGGGAERVQHGCNVLCGDLRQRRTSESSVIESVCVYSALQATGWYTIRVVGVRTCVFLNNLSVYMGVCVSE